ncbi:MAG: hypothetical protein A3K19_19120 [Lentisphaerae bacterium RIFOXYB12_FULL_65_16]|nr:MAG: hypothetical protein A3K18_23950 [Lentisphaerae bacterium RIFOXYA12_64_32]OGV91563.1 MAG: hypothetical protein A3K19_19120 [Lentisphaerae bacterium RIFOXYB12_FULL_65_16]
MPLRIISRERQLMFFDVALNGRIDVETSPQLDKFIDSLFKSPVRGLTFNMHDVEYVSSAGIRSVLLAMKKTKAAGGAFVMADLQAPVKKVFEIARVMPSENLFASVEEADKYFDTIQKREREKEKQKPAGV